MKTRILAKVWGVLQVDAEVYDFNTDSPEVLICDIDWYHNISSWDKKEFVCDLYDDEINGRHCSEYSEGFYSVMPPKILAWLLTNEDFISEAQTRVLDELNEIQSRAEYA